MMPTNRAPILHKAGAGRVAASPEPLPAYRAPSPEASSARPSYGEREGSTMHNSTVHSPWRIYRRLLTYTSLHWRVLLVAVVCMVGDAGCTTLFAKLIKPMLDRLFIDRDPRTIFWMPIWIVGIFAVRGVASYGSDYGLSYVGRTVVHRLREDIFAAYLALPASFFSNDSSGHHIARVTYTCEQVAQASTDAIKTALIDGLTVLGLIAVMIHYSPTLTLALLLLVPTVGFIAFHVSRSYRFLSVQAQKSMGSLTNVVQEALANYKEIRIYAGQAKEARRFAEISRSTRRLNLRASSTAAISTALVQFVAALALALIIFIATRPSILTSLSPGTFFAVLMAMGGILPSLKRLTTVQANIQRGVVAAEDLFAVIDQPHEADQGLHAVEGASGKLVVSNVHFAYQGQSEPALNDVQLVCRPGTVTALVGRSGSGKSTLSNLLPRFLDPERGCILLDDRDIREYELRSLRQHIAWVGQDIPTFNGTVRENIAYGELASATTEEIRAAARAANALDFIDLLPMGLDHPLGPEGTVLSGGQRQRLAIARAFLKDAPLLILDEATSSLDTESEHLIKSALARLMKHRTTLVIAHRLSTIQHADQIAVMDRGRIVESGSHTELLNAGGQYAQLYHLQFA